MFGTGSIENGESAAAMTDTTPTTKEAPEHLDASTAADRGEIEHLKSQVEALTRTVSNQEAEIAELRRALDDVYAGQHEQGGATVKDAGELEVLGDNEVPVPREWLEQIALLSEDMCKDLEFRARMAKKRCKSAAGAIRKLAGLWYEGRHRP